MNKQKTGLATAGMVLGIIGAFFAFISIMNVVSFVLGGFAVVFGGVSLIKKNAIGRSIAGLVLGIVSIVIPILVYNAVFTFVLRSSYQIQNAGGDTRGLSSEEIDFKTGEEISFDNKKVTVTGVSRSWDSGNQFVVPGYGNEFVKVEVSIQNDSKAEISYNAFDWAMQDSSGDSKDIAGASYMVEGALSSGSVAAGGKKTGFFVFEVPSGESGLKIRYSPTFWSNKNIVINL